MKTTLNTNLFPIISVAMYSTPLDADVVINEWILQNDYDEGYVDLTPEQYWDKFDNSLYVKHVQEKAHEVIDELDYEEAVPSLKIEGGEIYSPKYYNFANDQMELEVEFDKDEVLELIAKDKDNFHKFLKENFTSYDGFLSHTANNYGDWLADMSKDNVQAIGAALTYLTRDYIEEANAMVLEKVHEGAYYMEFINEEI